MWFLTKNASIIVAVLMPIVGLAQVTGASVYGAPEEIEQGASKRSHQIHIQKLRERAQQFRALHEGKPSIPETKEAKRQEALLLLQAGLAGDDAQLERRSQLVEELRRDDTLSPSRRCQLVAMGLYANAKINRSRSDAERIAKIERIERALIDEFPSAPNGYEALYRLALYSDDAKGRALAQELLTIENTPQFVKKQAEALLQQYALIGTSIHELLPEKIYAAKQKLGDIDSRNDIVICAWSSSHPGAISYVRFLQENALLDMRLVSICLDSDEGAGRLAAQAHGLLGEQLYDSTGVLAASLRLGESLHMVYIAGADGVIKIINGEQEIRSRFRLAGMRRSTEGQTK